MSVDIGPDLKHSRAARAVSNESSRMCFEMHSSGSLDSQFTSGVRKQESVWWWTPPSVPLRHMIVRKFRILLVAKRSFSVREVRSASSSFLKQI
jgi:hypothetical protein